VNDLVTDVDGRSELLKGELDDLDGPVHTGTESARAGEQDTHQSEG